MERKLNKSLTHLEMPDRMRRLKISSEGYPVPWFVPWTTGEPEFRGMDGEKLGIAVRHRKCWICSESLGRYMTFCIGPMCAITRTIAEPPSHHDCLVYSVKACPFLSQPRMRRNEKDKPEGHVAGVGLKRNPGVVLLWTTLSYKVFRAPNGGVLFSLGDPTKLDYYAEGRAATREEIMHSIETGLPHLREIARDEGTAAIVELEKRTEAALKLVPA